MNLPTPSRPMHREPPAACFEGWHDSSFELRHGLVVIEHDAFERWFDAPAPVRRHDASPKPPVAPRAGVGQ